MWEFAVQVRGRKKGVRIAAAALALAVVAAGGLHAVSAMRGQARLIHALRIGHHATHHGNPADAVRVLADAVRENPDSLAARDMLATVYDVTGQKEKALEQWRLAVKYNPRDADAYYLLATAYAVDKRFKEAAAVLESEKAAGCSDVAARQLLARCYWRMGERGKAAAELRGILKIAPGYTAPL